MLTDIRIRQRDFLLEIARSISQELDLDTLLERILTISAEMLSGQAGLIALRGAEAGWTVAASYGIPPTLLQYLDPLLAAVPDHGEPARFELPEINRILQQVARRTSLGLLTGVGLPLIARQRVIGVIFIFRAYAGGFSRNDLNVLQSFADQAAIGVHNAQLYSQVNQEKQRISALLDSVADGILILTPDRKIERASPSFARMYGEEAQTLQGKSHNEVVRWARLENGMTLDQAEAGGWPLTSTATFYAEGDLKRPVGSPLPAGITYAPLFSTENQLLHIIATVRDITHFREAEELKSTFISVISHELRTPVALIKGYVSTLRREDAAWDREVVESSLEVIEEESDRLASLIDNLLEASRLQADGLSLDRTDLSLAALAERMADRFRTQTQRHEIEVNFPENYPILVGDENRLTQVFSNLISNAIKYSPDGGTIRISGQIQADYLIVCISDDGPGFAPQDVPHVFDRFYRSNEAARTTKGAGLGLYLARAVVEAHGGRIWIDANTADGARICFSLPRSD